MTDADHTAIVQKLVNTNMVTSYNMCYLSTVCKYVLKPSVALNVKYANATVGFFPVKVLTALSTRNGIIRVWLGEHFQHKSANDTENKKTHTHEDNLIYYINYTMPPFEIPHKHTPANTHTGFHGRESEKRSVICLPWINTMLASNVRSNCAWRVGVYDGVCALCVSMSVRIALPNLHTFRLFPSELQFRNNNGFVMMACDLELLCGIKT